jgi:hypothetical protein
MPTKTKKKAVKSVAKKTKSRNQPATRPVQRDRMTRPQSERIQENPVEENLTPSTGFPFPNRTTPQRNPDTQRDPQDRANHEQWEAEKTVTGEMHYSGEDENTK